MKKKYLIENMIKSIKKLPNIGPKMAERLCYHILKMKQTDVDELLDSIKKARIMIKKCSICYDIGEYNPCLICSDPNRVKNILCIVETPQDLIAINKSKEYNGLYFVIGGVLSPLNSIGPNDIKINNLIKRLESDSIDEVIIATDTNSDGEITASYLASIIKKMNIKVTRLGYGLPAGGDIEYIDELTISRAICNRKEM
ncbi:MAG: recombination mediator RecR [Endomicrobium sp.]|jgi:recombination protein RecR|nr:recombination mediator RecR [Endomicrobium sp.]